MHELLGVVKAFFFSPFFVKTETSMSQLVVIYQLLSVVEKAVKARKEALRVELMEWVAAAGNPLEKGHVQAEIEGTKVLLERRRASEPSAEELKALLAATNTPILDAFDEVKVLTMNPSKVSYLVEVGRLKAADVEALRKVTKALKVTLSKPLARALKDITPVIGD